MIKWGYRLYEVDDELRFDQIVDGNVYSLVPTEADADRRLGYYDPDMKFLGADPDAGSEPAERDAPGQGSTGDRRRAAR